MNEVYRKETRQQRATSAVREMIEQVRARHANLDESELNALIEEAQADFHRSHERGADANYQCPHQRASGGRGPCRTAVGCLVGRVFPAGDIHMSDRGSAACAFVSAHCPAAEPERGGVGDFRAKLADTCPPGDLRLPGATCDSKDDAIVACAVEGQAQYIVSGDQDLLILEAYEGVLVLTPRQFLDRLK